MKGPILTKASINNTMRQTLLFQKSLWSVIAIAALISLHSSSLFAQNDVLTQHNDNGRTGQNLNETLLTPANVNVNQFGKLFTWDVDGIVVAQPLYASNVLMADGLVHNVVFVATQHNTVYAFDADSKSGSNAAPLWQVSLDDGGTTDPITDFGCPGTGFKEVGITSTPVIDAAKTTIYVVAKTVTPSGDRQFALHALDLTSGSETRGGPVVVTGSYGPDNFQVLYQLQRPALLLQDGVIYIAFGGNGCDKYQYNGWVFAQDAQTLQQRGVFEVAPNGKQSAIWQGGSGPSADEFGNIYVVTANGTYDGPGGENDYGDSVLKLAWNSGSLGIQDYFTPADEQTLQDFDIDLGSAGSLILPDQPGAYPHELIAGGKEGTLYLINRDSMGHFNPGFDDVIQSIPGIVPGELTGVPVYWNGNVYITGDRDYVKQFPMINGVLAAQPASQTTVLFSGTGPSSASLSANGNTNGILWVLQHSQHILYAFDPTNLATTLYSSKQALHARDAMSLTIRFVTPTISNGKVYVGGKSQFTVFGLLPRLSPSGGNNQTGAPKQVLSSPLTVLASDAYSHAPIPGLPVTCNDGSARGLFIPSATQTTDSTGTATFQYQLPPSVEVVSITCTSPTTTSAAFTEYSAPGVPTTLRIVSGNKQVAPPNTLLPSPLVVKVLDANGNLVPGVTVSFTDNGAGGSFSVPSAVTDSKGKATTQYTTGANTGKITITASAPGTNSVTFQETVQ
ncbi:MAG TPA: Ig-like domain-containing protein [Terriglobales bacterium]|nr:Ig-like domain-containing protein [Terriglobales bacterium]